MVDISMCQEEACTRKQLCYRYRAVPSDWQSYFMPLKEDGTCEYFWSIDEICLTKIRETTCVNSTS